MGFAERFYAFFKTCARLCSVTAQGIGGIGQAVLATLGIIVICIVLLMGYAVNTVVVEHQPTIFAELEHAARCIVEPIYARFIKPFLLTIEYLYNPLICLWNAAAGIGNVVMRQVVIPLLQFCGIFDVILAFLDFVKDFVFHVVNVVVQIFNLSSYSPVDFDQDGVRFAIFWTKWQSLVCCACNDICGFLTHLPIIPTIIFGFVPIPNGILVILPLIASNQIKDPQTWCTLTNALNAVGTAANIIINIVYNILEAIGTGTVANFERPNLRPLLGLLCATVSCAVRSVENSLQDFWDWIAPFPFNFIGWLCVVDSAACVALKIAGLLLDIIINIDEAVQYPDPAHQYWKVVVQPDLVEILNRIAPPTDITFIPVPPVDEAPLLFEIQSYYLDTNWDTIPEHYPGAGKANPVKNVKRLDACLCVFIRRFLCDPTDNGTACFNSVDSQAQTDIMNLLKGFDFCCLPNALLKLAVDLIAALYEFTLHFASPSGQPGEVFFRFIDQQPSTTIWVADLTQIANCLLEIFTLIPVIGPCIKDAIVALVRWALSQADLLIRVIIGLISLAYFIPVLHDQQGQPGCRETHPTGPGTYCWANFITRTNQAVNFFVAINNRLINKTDGKSLEKCLCEILNNGFPVPPVPCPNCTVQAFPDFLPLVRRDEAGNPLPDQQNGYKFPHGRLLHDENDPLSRPFDPFQVLAEMLGTTDGNKPEYDEYAPRSQFQQQQQASTTKPKVKMSPLLLYNSKLKTMNPWTLGNLIRENMKRIGSEFGGSIGDFFGESSIKTYLQEKKQETINIWQKRKSCGALFRESELLRVTNYNQWRSLKFHHKYDALGQCPLDILDGKEQLDSLAYRVSHYHSKHKTGKEDTNVVRDDRLFDLQPTEPSVFGCNPIPMCFDLCCIVRTALEFVVHVLNFTARFINGLAQGEDVNLTGGDIDNTYPYFSGALCTAGGDCFESDVIGFILKLFAVAKCACKFLNLLIPVTVVGGRGDICCVIQRIGELLAAIFVLLVNAITSLATGDRTDFVYFKEALFQADIAQLFFITREVVECGCVLIRNIFPGNFSQEFVDAVSFDPCCIVRVYVLFWVDVLQLGINMLISLATITVTPKSYCYWRLDRDICGTGNVTTGWFGSSNLSSIGFVIDVTTIIDEVLPKEELQCKLTCFGEDPGSGGVVPCFCQIINALLPIRDDPSKPPSCNATAPNCMLIDFCCPLVKTGQGLRALLIFAVEALAALWQSWDPGYPEYLTAYIFCDELSNDYAPAPGNNISALQNQSAVDGLIRPMNDNGVFTCGVLNPVIDSLFGVDGIFSRCLCAYFQVFDYLLAVFWTILSPTGTAVWGNCFCGTPTRLFGFAGPPYAQFGDDPAQLQEQAASAQLQAALNNAAIIPSLAYLIRTVIFTIYTLMRRLPDPTYWSLGNHLYGSTLGSIQSTWVYRFLAPTANAACLASGNIVCFINSFFFIDPNCNGLGKGIYGGANASGKRLFGGLIAWAFQAVIVAISLIEGFFQVILPPVCTGPDCSDTLPSYNGLKASSLGAAITALISFPVDLLIADGRISCNGICDGVTLRQFPDNPCACYNLSPKTRLDPTYRGFSATYQLQNPTLMANWWNLTLNTTSGNYSCRPYQDLPPNKNYDCSKSANSEKLYCSKYNLSMPTCVLSTCVDIKLCKYAELPTCGALPDTPASASGGIERFRALDGVVLAFIRYLSCIGLAPILYPLDFLLSVLWQLALYILRFIANMIILFFTIFALLSVPTNCECRATESTLVGYPNGTVANETLAYGKYASACYACTQGIDKADCAQGADLSAILATLHQPYIILPICSQVDEFFAALGLVIRSFFEIFTPDIDIPPNPYGARNARGDHMSFRKIKEKIKRDGIPPMSQVSDYLYSYNVMDCMFSDLIGCLDRNFEIPYSVERTENSMLFYLAQNTFTSPNSPVSPICDAVMMKWAEKDNVDWATETDTGKKQVVECLEKRIQGERLHLIMDDLPNNYFYSSTGILELARNAYSKAKNHVYKVQNLHDMRRSEADNNLRRALPRLQIEIKERQIAAEKEYAHLIGSGSMVYHQMLRMDDITFKYQSGYYGHLFRHAVKTMSERGFGVFLPTPWEAGKNVLGSVQDIGIFLYEQEYAHFAETLMDAHAAARVILIDIVAQGPIQYFKNVHNGNYQRMVKSNQFKREIDHRRRMADLFEATPLIKWLRGVLGKPLPGQSSFTKAKESTTTTSELPPVRKGFIGHLANVIDASRTNWQEKPASFFNMDLHFRHAYTQIKEHVTTMNTRAVWTPEKSRNYEQLVNFGKTVANWLYPGSVERNRVSKELAIAESNAMQMSRATIVYTDCKIFDETVDIVLRLIGYCALEFVANTPNLRGIPTEKILNYIGPSWAKKNDMYKYELMPLAKQGFSQPVKFLRKQPTIIGKDDANKTKAYCDYQCQEKRVIAQMDKRSVKKVMHLRAATLTPSGTYPATRSAFDLDQWIFDRVNDLLGLTLDSDVSSGVNTVKAWFTNTNRDIHDYPDVGFIFWLIAQFSCYFPFSPWADKWPNNNNNLDCGIGWGIETSLGFTFKWWFFVSIGVGIMSSVVPLLGQLAAPVILLSFPIANGWLAWFYSPGCLALAPTFWPLPLPALPQCAANDLFGLINKYIATDYGFLLPSCMYNGISNLPCSGTNAQTRIAFISCKYDVGMSNGFQSLLYLGYLIFPNSLHSIVRGISTSVIGVIAPGIGNYLNVTLSYIEESSLSPTLDCRFKWCAGLFGIGSILPIIALSLLFGGILIAIFSCMLNVGGATYTAIEASPINPFTSAEWLDFGTDVPDNNTPLPPPPPPPPEPEVIEAAIPIVQDPAMVEERRKQSLKIRGPITATSSIIRRVIGSSKKTK